MGKDQELLEACRTGNVSAIEKLLAGRLGAKGKGAGGGGALSSISKSFWSLKSANVNCQDASGDTPLHLAALNGHIEIVTMLLDCEASATALDSQDCSPLHLAAWSGHTDICSQLLNLTDGQGLINLQTRDGNTALHFAAQHGHDNTLSLLLQKKADPTIRNLEDLSPLDLAAQYDRLDIVKQLVTSHPALVAQRSMQQTPLHLASRNGHRSVVQYLLDSGFPLDAKTDKGSALHEAANFCKLDVIRLLLDRGIDIHIKSQTGCTAEDILRSIPSKTAEDALNILKAHIYHQRTPDSDGERAIVPGGEPDSPKPSRPLTEVNLPEVTVASSSVPTPVVQVEGVCTSRPHGPTAIDKKIVHRRSTAIRRVTWVLPAGTVGIGPPPIPPRQSVRVPDQTEQSEGTGFVPLKVPSDKGSDKEPSSDEEKAKLRASPRDLSPSTRNPSDLPKKPPRKKPLSFRRPDQGPGAQSATQSSEASENTTGPSEAAMPGSKFYINMDPQQELANIEAKLPVGSQAADAESAQTTSTSKVSSALDNENDTTSKELDVQQTTTTEKAEQDSTVDESKTETENKRDSAEAPATKPPTSLELESKRESSEVTASPSRRQPPTPDCPPPSPGTALQNIQKKIPPMEKRRSRDMETSTDAAVISQDDVSIPSSESVLPEQNIATLTPVSEHPQHPQPPTQGMITGVTHPQPSTEALIAGAMPIRAAKPKPVPLPRRSSLSSETKDLPSKQSQHQEGHISKDATSQNQVPSMPQTDMANQDVSMTGESANFRPVSAVDQVDVRENGEPGQGEVQTIATSSSQASNGVEADQLRHEQREPMTMTDDALELLGEPVQMRRSVSAGNEPDWEGHVFADLFRGSVVGGARDVVHQLCGTNNAVTAAALRKKRKSTASTFVTFAPLMEEDKDIDTDKILSEINSIGHNPTEGKRPSSDEVFDDDSEEWAKIAEIISSYGGRISSSGDYALFEAHIEQLLSAKGENKIQSVGEWLQDIGLPQYENTLVANGFDDTDFLGGNILEDQDLSAIGVENAEHRNTILAAAADLPVIQSIDLEHPPETVAEWLGSLRLDYYFDTFMSHKFDTMERVVHLWELELVTVLDITSIGHRKRMLASLGDKRPHTASPARSRVASTESFSDTSSTKSPFDNVDLYRDYTGVRSRVNDPAIESPGQGSLFSFDSDKEGESIKGRQIRDSSIHIRAPHLMHYTGSIKQWRHKPEVLIKGCCNYTAHYLGSTLVKELKGAISTQEGIAKLKKSTEVISKIPTIRLSISFKGVKFIDAASKKVVCDHEIANIFCACQDGEHMNFFAYITKDREVGKHYCHVFSVRSKELAGEIILTLGEAFEIAYQMALKEKAEQEAEEFDKRSVSDGDDTTSISSKASVNTV